MTAVRRNVRAAARRAAATVRSTPRPLAVLLVLTALLGVAWCIATPPFEGADESSHAAYVQHLAETGHAPTSTGTGPAESDELATALTVFNLGPIISNQNAVPNFAHVDRSLWDAFERQATGKQRSNGSSANAVGKYPPLYYAVDVIPYKLAPGSLLDKLFFMRLYSVLLYVATVLFAWLLAAELFSRQWPRVVTAGAVAMQPKLGYLAGIVNPDIQLIAIWSAFAWMAMRTLRRGPTPARVAWIAALTAASLLTQPRGLAILAPAGLTLLLAWVRYRRARLGWLRDGAIAAVCVALVGIYVLHFSSAHSSGGAFGGEISKATGGNGTGNARQFLSYLWQFYFPKLSFMQQAVGPPNYGYRQVYIETFFSSQGGLEVVYKTKTFDLLQLGAFLGLVLLYTQAIVARALLVRFWRELLVLVTMCVALLGLLHVTAYHDLLTNPAEPLITGRYLLMLVPVFALAIAFCCYTLPRRIGTALAGALLAIGVILQFSSLALSMTRFYA